MPINNVGGTNAAGYGGLSPENEAVATVRVGENTISDVASRLKLDSNALLQANPQIKDSNQKLRWTGYSPAPERGNVAGRFCRLRKSTDAGFPLRKKGGQGFAETIQSS
jgi:hypothetical protein